MVCLCVCGVYVSDVFVGVVCGVGVWCVYVWCVVSLWCVFVCVCVCVVCVRMRGVCAYVRCVVFVYVVSVCVVCVWCERVVCVFVFV